MEILKTEVSRLRRYEDELNNVHVSKSTLYLFNSIGIIIYITHLLTCFHFIMAIH